MNLACQEVRGLLADSRGEESISLKKEQKALVAHLEKCDTCIAEEKLVCKKAVIYWIQNPGFHLEQPRNLFALWCANHMKGCKDFSCETLRSYWAAQRGDANSWKAGQNSMFLLYVSGKVGIPWVYMPALSGYVQDLISGIEQEIGEVSAQMLRDQLKILLNKIMGESTPPEEQGVRREDMRDAILGHLGKVIGEQKASRLWEPFDAFFLLAARPYVSSMENTGKENLLRVHSGS